MANKITQIKNNLNLLIQDYESSSELQFMFNSKTAEYDISQLPNIIQDMTRLVTTKSSSFSDISAVGMALFVLSGLFGQARPQISAQAYSDDILGVNFYGLILAGSGKGKDSSHKALIKACGKAFAHVQHLKEKSAVEKAKRVYIKTMAQSNPDFDKSQVAFNDYEDIANKFIEDLEPIVADIKSSRGGLTSSMNRMSDSEYGITSIFSSELSMSIESSPFPPEVLELLATVYDMGESNISSFKSAESKEKALQGVYPNFLGITNATSFFTEGPTRNVLVPKLKGAFLRRMFTIFSDTDEEYQNVIQPTNRADKKLLQVKNRQVIHELTSSIDNRLLEAIKGLLGNTTIAFDTEAESLYDDYFGYCESIAMRLELTDSTSTEATEVSGKAFRTGRVAALFALAQNKRIVDYKTLKAAILFADHCSVHSVRLMKALSLQKYQLMVLHYEDGVFGNTLSLSEAITRGYITTKEVGSKAMMNFLSPVNSDMKGRCVVTYCEEKHEFTFTPLARNTNNLYSFRATKVISEDKPVPKELINKGVNIFSKLLITNSSINSFIGNTTKVVILTVDKSLLSIGLVNHYLADIKHWIAYKSDAEDESSFTVILPVNMEISKSDYKFISMSIAEQFLLNVAPETCEPEYIHHGYNDAVQFSSDATAKLFDVSGIITNAATSTAVPKLLTKASAKPTAAAINKFVTTEIETNIETIINITNVSNTPLLFLASIAYTMLCKYVSDEVTENVINSINNSIEHSFSAEDINKYVLEPFKGV